MPALTSFASLALVALGLVFVMPQSPLSFLSPSLELQNPAAQLAQFIQGTTLTTEEVKKQSILGDATNQVPTDTGILGGAGNDALPKGFVNTVTNNSSSVESQVNQSVNTASMINEGVNSNTPINTGSRQTGNEDGTIIINPIKPKTVQEFISILLGELVKVGYVVGVCFIVYAGFQFVTGGESDTKRTNAKNTLMWTVIGLGILLGAQAIAFIVFQTLQQITNAV